MKHLYTVGHSIYELKDFVSLLKKYSINTIVDVRSMPYSKFASQYNRELLKYYLKDNNIYYIYMGDTLGARYEDKNLLFDDGTVNFKEVQKTKRFQDGIRRLEKGIAKGYNISLMCSEKEAFDCHRFVLISQFLSKLGIDIEHIYPNKSLSQQDLEELLLKKYDKRVPKKDLFNPDVTYDEMLRIAYKLRNRDIAYNAITKEGDKE